MKLNQSLTAAITAAALVAGAGFAVAQTSTTTESAPQVTNTPGDSSAQGPLTQNQGASGAAGSMNSSGTVQSQPSTSMDTSTSAAPSVDTTLEPRADRN